MKKKFAGRLLAGAAMGMSLVETKMGRLMRAPDGHDGGTGGDNAGGNSDHGVTPPNEPNNGGQEFDAASFWGSQNSDDDAAPNGESAGDSPGSGTEDFGTQLATQLNTMNFGDLFDDSMVNEINEGNYGGLNQRFNGMAQNVMRQSVVMAAKVMQVHGEKLMSQIRQEMNVNIEGREDMATLIKDFPAAKNPKVAPVIQRVFNQALQNTNYNRELAVQQTKQMMQLMTQEVAGDLGISISEQRENPQQGSDTNWLEVMLGKQ